MTSKDPVTESRCGTSCPEIRKKGSTMRRSADFAPWCPACQQLQPEWNDFAEWGDDIGVSIAKVDVTEEPGLSGRFIITALPTIYQ
ncbi:UNVERIFIED_CONTAM: hypothetical protein FKN15_035193 [Acipenser sinensis]